MTRWNSWIPFQAATFRSAVGLIGYIVLDRPECQYAAKTVRSATREPTNLDWMRMMRLAKFLVSHSELEWIYQAQDVPEKYMWCLETQTGQARSHVGVRQEHLNSMDCIPSNSTARHSTSLPSRAERQSCMLQDVRQREDCHQSRLLVEAGMEPKLEVLTESSANLDMHNRIGSGRVRHLDVKWLWLRRPYNLGGSP